jgi:hypothetical protein
MYYHKGIEMTNDEFYLELDLCNTPLKDSYVFPDHLCKSISGPSYDYVPIEYISDDLKQEFDNLNLTIAGAVIFRKLPKTKNPLHTDIVLENNEWKIWHGAVNWNLSNSDSTMKWYSTTLKEVWPKITETDEPYFLSGIHYGFLQNRFTNVKGVELIETFKLAKPTLVRTDIPHQIENLENTDRWSLSIRFTDNYEWNDLLKIFQKRNNANF